MVVGVSSKKPRTSFDREKKIEFAFLDKNWIKQQGASFESVSSLKGLVL